MDPTAVIEPQSNGSEPNVNTPSISQSNGDKRALDDDNVGVEGCVKRRRFGGEMKRVAEIVLVLSAMGPMRGGGRRPSEAEVELMAEARRKVVELCGGLAPQDVVGRDAVERVIDDLGLSSGGGVSKDGRVGGFCGQKLSMAERMEFSRKKMEESKKFLARATTYTSQPPQANVSAVPAFQTTSSEVRTTRSSIASNSSHIGRDSSSSALPRVEGGHVKVEGGANGGTSHSSQLRGSSPANHMSVNVPPWSVQQPSASSTRFGPDNRVNNPNSVKVGAANGIRMFNMPSQAARDPSIRPVIAQNMPGNLPRTRQTLPGMNHGQAPSPYNPHIEIAKTIQKLLQPITPEHPSWTPSSREYMTKAFTCQICKVATNEVSTVLVCDACDKGYHIKCIKLVNQHGVPRGEWHCQKCLILSNGKPLPPKYGRVTRSTNAPKVPSSTTGAQGSQEKKVAAANKNVAEQKIRANGSPAVQKPADSSVVGRNYVETAVDSKVSSASGGQVNNVPDKSAVCSSIQHNQNLSLSTNEKVSMSVIKSEPLAILLSPASSNEQNFDQIRMQNRAKESSERNFGSNLANKRPEDCYSTENTVSTDRCDVRRDDQSTTAAGTGTSDHSGLSSDGLRAVEWVGDVLQVVDGKKNYQTCCISGVIYKVNDYALFRFSPDKSTPSKLKAMWEDIKTGSKWLIVRKCYFPADLPEIVGRPYTSGSNEVFESNQDSIVTPSSFQGPCEVLSVAKFEEEIEWRNHLGADASSKLKPIFLCKWLYDEVKGTFQPSSN